MPLTQLLVLVIEYVANYGISNICVTIRRCVCVCMRARVNYATVL